MRINNELDFALLLKWARNFSRAEGRSPRVAIVAVFCVALAVSSSGQSGSKPAPPYSARAANPAKSLPRIFASVLADVKAKARIPVLLPSELPKPIAEATLPVVGTTSEDEYNISLYYKTVGEGILFAAFFKANRHPDYEISDIGNVSEVKLSRGLVGYFRPVGCGGSCAPANLWWEDDHILYQIQLKLSPTLPEDAQQRTIIKVANSAILAGPR
jgi:hypothetical protein